MRSLISREQIVFLHALGWTNCLCAALVGLAAPTLAESADARPASTPSGPLPEINKRESDWPMWGGTPDRNMVSAARNLPVKWDLATKSNVRWVADLGTRTYGNAVVSGGKIFIGTNNGRPRHPDAKGDQGVLMCFAESDGRFLWQTAYKKLTPPQKFDWPEIGLCSTACVVGNRVYFVSNRCELVCADTEGFTDGRNGGPVKDARPHRPHDANIVWSLDMRKELGVVPLFGSSSAPLVLDDLVFVSTGNSVDDATMKPAAPQAPSFIAVNRHTGTIVWKNASPGENIIFGQWSSPAVGLVNGQQQVVFAGGDGWLYGFEPASGKLLWKFNCRAYPEALPDGEKDENTLVGTPVVYDNKVFIAVGRDPESGGGRGALWAIDAAKTGDITQTGRIWCLAGKEFDRSASTVAIADGLLYAAETEGFLNCLEAMNGKRLWRQDLNGKAWASPVIADGKVYMANEDGDVFVLRHHRQKELLGTNSMRETMYSTVVAANGSLYIVTREHLYAIGGKSATTATASAPAADAGPRHDEWAMFRGNAQLTGVAMTPLTTDLQIRWKFNAHESIQSTAAIAAGVAYVGCESGLLYALDIASGTEKWKYETKAPIRSSPCVVGGAVFVGDGNGVFHAVDARTGKRRWTLPTEGEIYSSPNHTDGKLLFGSYDGYLYCVAADGGRVIWKTETEGRIHGSAAVAADKVVVAGCDEKFHVFRLSDGGTVAAVNMGSLSGASAAVSGPLAVVGTFNNQVLAVDWTAGKIAWTYHSGQEPQPFYSSAAVTNDVVVIGGRDGLLHAIDIRTGKGRWTFTTRGKIDASPVIVGERVVAASTDGCIYVINLASGKSIWQFDSGSSFLASPAVGEECMVIGTDDGIVYCFGDNAARGADAGRTDGSR